jgi:signal transduction histidine kinase
VKKLFAEEMDKGVFEPMTMELEAMHKDGSTVWIEILVSFLRDKDGQVTGILGVTRDITERKRFARRLASAQEGERRRLSERLHDELGQLLTVAKIRLDRLRDARFDDMVALTKELSEVSSLLSDALENTRDLSQRLRPPLLDQLGLVPALRSLAAQFESNTGTPIEVNARSDNGHVPEDLEMLVYRVVQEALTNVARHAHAGKVSVELVVGEEHVEFSVVDDGRGFNVRGLEKKTDCLGIRSMRTRVMDSGGVFDITSDASRGTTVYVRLPLGRRED